jgi:hypothetical protein
MSPGETVKVNIAWAADNDGQPSRGEFDSTSPTSIIGIKLLGSTNPDAKISYNWWVSDAEGYPKDWGPWLKVNQEKWKEINPYGSGIYFPDKAMGTPGGDRSKYFLLCNGEIDFDQVFTDTLPKVNPSWAPAPSQYSRDLVQGFDIRFLYSFGPFDIPPGDTIFAAVALVAGENLHTDPANRGENLPENPYLYYENLDFSDLVYNAQEALEAYESRYTLPPAGPPDNFYAYLMGDNTVRLRWSPKQGPNLKGYNIYRGLSWDDPSPKKVNPEIITGRFYIDEGLREGEYYTYWIASENQYGVEGMRSSLEILAGRPRTPQRLRAEASKDQVLLSWSGSRENDLAGYRIYRTDKDTTLMIDFVGLVPDYRDVSVTNGVIYYYRVTAVDSLGLESFFSDSVYALPMAFDQGIGVIDRTTMPYCNRLMGFLDFGDSVGAFYQRAAESVGGPWNYVTRDGYHSNWDITLRDLSPFPVVIIHAENLDRKTDPRSDTSTAWAIRHYLRAGGKLIFEGTNSWNFFFSFPPEGADSSFCDSRYIRLEDSLFCSCLFFEDVFAPRWALDRRNEEFVGAFSTITGYPDLEIDPDRVDSCVYGSPHYEFEPVVGKLPGVGYITPKDTSAYPLEVIYAFHSAYDTSDLEGKPVAVRYLGDDYKFVFFNFPLYFIKEEQAIQVLQQALRDLGAPTSVEEESEEEILTGDFSLEQNYPNPFNLTTTIPFTVHGERRTVNSPVRTALAIHNILGQKVRTLVNEEKLPGQYRVMWDGKDEKGNEVGSGVYLYQLKAGDFQQTKKMILLK